MGDVSGQGSRARRPPKGVPEGRAPVTIPAEYLVHLLEVARRFQVRSDVLLRDAGVRARSLDEPGAVVPRAAFMRVVERALELSGEPGLGFYHGLSLKLSSHGALGMLAMTANTLRDALDFVERYLQLRAMELTLRRYEEGEMFVLEFEHRVPPPLEVFFSESLFVMLLSVGRALLGHPLPARCELPFPEPAHFRRFAHLLPQVQFNATKSRLCAPRALLDEAVVTSDSVMARRIERECQRELSALRERASVLIALRRELRRQSDAYPSLEQVAARLGYSTRTLKRKLAAQGTSYRSVLSDLRRERASTLLRTTTLPLERIASLLGYSDVATLHRSFRRWYGTTPEAHRAQRQLR